MTAPTKTRTKTAVHFYVEQGFLVRGTQDPHTALALAVDDEQWYRLGYLAEVVGCRREGNEFEATAEQVRAFGDELHELLATARVGLFRIVPAHPDDDYQWFTRYATKRARGVFEGVEFL